MELLAIAIMGIVNIACFVVGAKVGQAVRQGEKIEAKLPAAGPMDGFRSKKTERLEQERLEMILRNVEAYNGTSAGQKEVK